MTQTAAIKSCSVCGLNLTGAKRVKDGRGVYFCPPCWTARTNAAQADQPELLVTMPIAPASRSFTTSPGPAPAQVKSASAGRRRLWQNKYVQLSGIGVVILVAVVAVPFWNFSKDYDEKQKQMKEAADHAGDAYAQMSKDAARRAAADEAEANALREKAAKLRGNDATSDQESTGPKSKLEAIHADPVIMGYLDSHPELESMIKAGGSRLNAHLDLLVTQGKLDPSDCQYIRDFSSKISRMPF